MILFSQEVSSGLHGKTTCTAEVHPALREMIQVSANHNSGSKTVFQEFHCGAAETNPTSDHKVAGSTPGLASGLRIRYCHELWWRSQIQLGSGIGVVVV